jgi:peptide-methionine (S)-S-oxide reductase
MKFVFLAFVLFVSACSVEQTTAEGDVEIVESDQYRQAIFAGGCFWCMEPPYDELAGVVATTSGYAGGHLRAPTYQAVTAGRSGHLEVVQVTYDPKLVSYEELLDVYWRNVDPLDAGGQFCDRGESYTTAIFATTPRQVKLATNSKRGIEAELGRAVVTPVRELEAPGFYPAEDYHQNYYQKNPIRYKYYRASCRRDQRLESLWGS